MLRIINGKKYDTQTATLLSSYEPSIMYEPNTVSRSLYQKKNSEFFIHLKTRCGCEAIIPMTLEEAKHWVENYHNSGYEFIFGTVEE